ncbi:hypothetical protein [Brevibacillus invocatus]|uniref:hypothetical protein n=1 Tax=Brevibacillus invocatus TaxID=173959 RepID=UPI00203A7450|nr:hypothetical protein [Brevibacillus invocatus]MCM3081927.1 hypothetical protein [Brevibacillus invocatus]MCM3432333.1 hypothetical protein [Brevibacillus invocatus]
MTAFKNPMSINTHVHSNQDSGIPTMQDNSKSQGHHTEVVSQFTTSEDIKRFYEDSLGLIVLRFTNYKGIPFREMSQEAASNAVQEIQSALRELPVRPDVIVDGEDEFTAAWEVPDERRFCGFTPDELDRVYENMIAVIASLGVTTPEYGDIGLVEDLFTVSVDQYREQAEKRAKLEAFDRMADLQIVVR